MIKPEMECHELVRDIPHIYTDTTDRSALASGEIAFYGNCSTYFPTFNDHAKGLMRGRYWNRRVKYVHQTSDGCDDKAFVENNMWKHQHVVKRTWNVICEMGRDA
ncbi:hypothetical protein J6590_103430 [Homalodisca vitripennis]|nr:hypothetical protein J6590_103430 [Homalodisca vitripennis]